MLIKLFEAEVAFYDIIIFFYCSLAQFLRFILIHIFIRTFQEARIDENLMRIKVPTLGFSFTRQEMNRSPQ